MSPTAATAGATGLNLAFTFTSANDGTGGYDLGAQLTLVIPAGWTAPQSTSSGASGYVSVSSGGPGTCHVQTGLASITGTGPWTIAIDLRCNPNRQFVINYGNVTAPTSAAAYTFTTQTANANGTLTSLASSPVVTVNAAAANRLSFSAAPGNSAAGTPFSTQPVVVVQDQYGNTVSGSTASITLAIQTNPGGGTLTCTANPKAAVSGTATFAGCSINKVGSGYRLSAAAAGLTGATTGTFDITPGTATNVAFTTQPGGATVGSTFTVQPVVMTRDANGNNSTVGLPSSLTLSLTIASGTGTLLGTTTVDVGTAAGNGVATFSNLEIDTAQTYTLQAAVAGGVLSSATSSSFTVARANTTTVASNATANLGDATVVLSATVADGNATVNEGTVTFTVKDGAGTVIGTPVTSGSVSGGSASAVFSLSGVPAARYSIFATYNAAGVNPNFNASSAAAATLTVTTTVLHVISGAYTGNGVAGTEITLLGFVPDVVLVKSDAAQEPVIWTSTMTGGGAKPVSSGTAAASNLIQTATINGFKVGSDARVNAVGTNYYWTAFGAATGGLVVGSYTGNGTGQGITGIGFQPDLLVVMGEAATNPVFRTSAMSGTVTLSSGTATGTRISSLDANGFTVGTGATVNSNAVVYHYAAWTANTGKVAVGAYAGSGAARSVTGLGFPPQFSFIKSTDCASAGQQHSSALGPSTDASLPFDSSGGSATGRITALQSNGFAVGSDASVNGSGCNYAWAAFAGDAPTAVRMQSASATRYDNGTFIEWKTAYEAENLGFNVYREEDSVRERLTPSILAGSGLLVGPGPAAAAQTYGWWDLKRHKGSKATYWLEDVDLNGTRTWHGPIAPADGDSAKPDVDGSQATLLKRLGRERHGAPAAPAPANGNTRVTVNTTLGWRAPGATSYDVRLGTANPPDRTISNLSHASYAPATLAVDTTYYWQVTAHFADGTRVSPVWSFTTIETSSAPAAADPLSALPSGVSRTALPLEDAALTSGGELTAADTSAAVETRAETAGSAAPSPVSMAAGFAPSLLIDRATTKAADDSAPVRANTSVTGTSRASTDARAPLSSPQPASESRPVIKSSAATDSMESTESPQSASLSASTSAPTAPQNVRVIAPAPANAGSPGVPPSAPQNLRLGPPPRPADVQRMLAAGSAVKLAVSKDGWYRVTQDALMAAGLPADTDPATLQLFVDGVERRIAVPRASTGEFALEFYGTGGDMPNSNERVYWVVAGRGPGLRVVRVRWSGEGNGGAGSFPYTAEKRDRTIYFAALLNGDAENFFGDIVTSEPVDEILNVQHLDPSGTGATLEVTLQGVTEGADGQNHQVDVQVNGIRVGELVFAGREHVTRSFSIPTSALRSGDNTITLTARGDEGEVSLVDTIRLTYPHTYTADADLLRFTAEGQRRVTVDGFTGAAIKVIDISDPSAVLDVVGSVTATAAGYGVTFQVPATGTRTLVAFTDGHVLAPASVRANAASGWRDSVDAADYVILTHSDFGAAVSPLAGLRRQQGHAVAVVDLEDVYDEFSFGQKRPEAVRDFLLNAHDTWSKAPRFVVLVGNASTDPRNYLGTGEQDFVPTKLVATSVLETASDDWFADADGDGLPELAMVGRLPARTAEQAQAMVNKIVAYDASDAGAWARSISLVADATAPGDGDFAASSRRTTASPTSSGVRQVRHRLVPPSWRRSTMANSW